MKFHVSKGGQWYKDLCVHSLQTWHLKADAIHSRYFRLSQVLSRVSENDLPENDKK